LLKGQAGSQVKVITQRLGMEPVMHELVREEIKIPDVPYKGMVDRPTEVGYIKLNSFTQTAGQEVRNALKELKEQGAKKMILDLRGNGGGSAARSGEYREPLRTQERVGGGDQGQDPRMGQDLQDLERTGGCRPFLWWYWWMARAPAQVRS
jgi:hypothetical protein